MAFPTGWTKHKITIDLTSLSLGGSLSNYTVILKDNQFLSAVFSNSQGKEINSNWLLNDANLQAYYRLSELTDESSNGYDLTNNNSAVFASGLFGNGVDLEDSSSQYLSIADASCPNLEISGTVTYSAWVKPESITGTHIIMGKNGGVNKVELKVNSDGTANFTVFGITGNSITSFAKIKSGKWSHICGVYDGTNIKIFVNGQKREVGSTGSISDTDGDFRVGRDNTGNYFDGLVDDVAVFDRGLSDEEVVAVFTGGADIRFSSDAAGSTQLPHEVVNWDVDNSEAEVYVKVSTVSTTTTDVFVWYNNSTATPLARTDTYGSDNAWGSQYKGLFHSEKSFRDSTSNGNDLTPTGTPDFVTGTLGGGLDFESGSSEYASETSPTGLLITGDMSFSCWLKVESLTSNVTIIATGLNDETEAGNVLYNLTITTAGEITCFHEYSTGSNEVNTTSGLGISAGTWYHLVITRNVTDNDYEVYLDGASQEVLSYTNDPTGGGSGSFRLASDQQPAITFDGILDEVRVTNSELTADWIKTDYNLQNTPDTYITAAAINSYQTTLTESVSISDSIRNLINGIQKRWERTVKPTGSWTLGSKPTGTWTKEGKPS